MGNTSGSLLNSPFVVKRQNPEQKIVDAYGNAIPRTDDPAWQPPRDPLEIGNIKDNALIINREIPIITTQSGWEVGQVRAAIESLVVGLFDAPAQLVDAIIGDSRVQSALSSRTGGLLGRPINFKIPVKYKKDKQAQECLDEWQRHWPTMATEHVLADMQTWGPILGFWLGQQLWDTSGEFWSPYLLPWHPRYTYYHWIRRKLVAITLDGQAFVDPGNSHWILHAPNGEYRGWMRGALRAIAPWWLARNYALRDWARYSERHGMPIGKATTPMGADKEMVLNYRAQLAQLGQESILQLPQSSVPEIGKYDFEWCETKDQAWEGFQGLIEQCNAEITLALLGQNLTSEVKEGSFAAARIHADVRQAILEADARAISQTIYMQVTRPFAAINFGNPDLAPRTEWDVAPYEDNQVAATTLVAFANAVKILNEAGKKVTNIEDFAKQFGLFLTRAEIKEISAPSPDSKLKPGQKEDIDKAFNNVRILAAKKFKNKEFNKACRKLAWALEAA